MSSENGEPQNLNTWQSYIQWREEEEEEEEEEVEEEVERYLHLYMMLIFTTYLVVGTHLTTTQKQTRPLTLLQ